MKLLSLLALLPFIAHAEDAPLDKAYRNLKHPRIEWNLPGRTLTRRRNDVLEVIRLQTDVKAQVNRGTCSIFSATALLESLIVKARLAGRDLDLSEEWLQYLIAQTSAEEGSESLSNFAAIKASGMPTEAKFPYIGESWEDTSEELAAVRCGSLSGYDQKRCLVGHRSPYLLGATDQDLLNPQSKNYDPEFSAARASAIANKKYFSTQNRGNIVGSNTEVKELLSDEIPLTLDIDFFYGAWNHRLAEEKGLGRDMDLWNKGIVTYPEQNSLDYLKSQQDPAGHSVVIVGYDDTVEIKYTVKMQDGSTKTFKRKGVYYFKNSWGTGKFGVDFKIDGNSFPGYGMISQDYANEYGQFFRFDL